MSFLTKDMYRIRGVDDSPTGVPRWQVARVPACVQLSPMRHITFVLCSGIVLGAIIAPALSAQVAGPRTAEQIQASYDAHHADFDYLLGDWEFTAVNRQYGKFRGYWSAVRLGDGGEILDEYRVVGDKDETYYVTRTLRAYNAVRDQWELVSTEQGGGL